MQNRFQELCTEQESDDENTCTGDNFGISGLDIFVSDKVINGVGRRSSGVGYAQGHVAA